MRLAAAAAELFLFFFGLWFKVVIWLTFDLPPPPPPSPVVSRGRGPLVERRRVDLRNFLAFFFFLSRRDIKKKMTITFTPLPPCTPAPPCGKSASRGHPRPLGGGDLMQSGRQGRPRVRVDIA